MAERPIYGRNSDSDRVADADQHARPIEHEDAELIERIKAGNAELYGDLVRKYQDRVYNTCWRICGHLEDARDLTQEAFLKGFDRLGEFEQRSSFYTWIFRVAVNLALSHRRRGQRRSVQSLDQLGGASETQASGLTRERDQRTADDPSRNVAQEELRGSVAGALLELDEEHRAVIVLRDIEGFDYREIAEVLAIPAGTVKSRLHRARVALRDAIQPVTDC